MHGSIDSYKNLVDAAHAANIRVGALLDRQVDGVSQLVLYPAVVGTG